MVNIDGCAARARARARVCVWLRQVLLRQLSFKTHIYATTPLVITLPRLRLLVCEKPRAERICYISSKNNRDPRRHERTNERIMGDTRHRRQTAV